MEQYIPLDALVAWASETFLCENASIIRKICYKELLEYLNTLEVKEVDLEKETKKWWKERLHLNPENQLWMDAHQSIVFAKHFFELGISVSNSTKVTTPDVDDVLKENGVNPDSKEAKIIKESYFMAIEKLAQKGK